MLSLFLSTISAIFNAAGRLGLSAMGDKMKDRNTIYKLIFIISIVLTGIVVSVSVTALMLSLTIRMYQRYHTLDLDEVSTQLRKEGL